MGATGLLLAHNNPTGNLQPSKADISLTEKIKVAAQAIDIQLLNHLIVSENGYFSFADKTPCKCYLFFAKKSRLEFNILLSMCLPQL